MPLREIERLNGRVMVAFNRRFDPSARQLRRSIDAGEIGDVRQVIITSRDPESRRVNTFVIPAEFFAIW